MNIVYSSQTGRFELQFSTDFQGDYTAAKSAGFKCDGPPSWLWWTVKLNVLNKLRANKPASGLTITDDAFAQYTRLTEMEAQNEAARALFAPIKEEQEKVKKQRKREQKIEQTYHKVMIPEKPGELYDYIGAEDLPPMPPWKAPERQPWTGPLCAVCEQPVYPYECTEPTPVCLWCEKKYVDLVPKS